MHSHRWSRWSSSESAEGTALAQTCRDLGVSQVVRGPTRESYLLDLAMTDIHGLKAKVIPGVSNRSIVIASLRLKVPECETIERTMWQHKDADWDGLRDTLANTDWAFINTTDTSVAAQRVADTILEQAHERIPQQVISEQKTSTTGIDFDDISSDTFFLTTRKVPSWIVFFLLPCQYGRSS